MKILVTGASGFIGSFIVEEALRRGMDTWAAMRRSSSKQYLQDERIHFIELDLDNQQQLEQQAQQAQLEMEQAAQNQVEETPPAVDPATLPHRYEAVKADVGWLEAQQEAMTRGGYLVTINTSEELQQVIDLATQAGFDRVWIGGHRVDGNLVWESGEDNVFYQWDVGEPSYTDSGDGAAEDYIMLWQRNGTWVYNDSRENPLTNFYGMYGGHIGFVVEIVG